MICYNLLSIAPNIFKEANHNLNRFIPNETVVALEEIKMRDAAVDDPRTSENAGALIFL